MTLENALENALEQLLNDKQIKKAFHLIIDTIQKKQAGILGVQGPHKKSIAEYAKLIKSFSGYRAGNLYYPYIASGLGSGPFVKLLDGSVKYDLINGIGVHLGHSVPKLIEAGLKASIQDTVMQGNLQQNISSYTLVKQIADLSGLDHCFLTSSGAMAVENALKLAFHQKPNRPRVLAFENCFSGRTLSLASLTDKPAYRKGLPDCLSVDYIPFYNHHLPVKESVKEMIRPLIRTLNRYPGQHAAMVLELVQGEGGFYPGHRDFFIALMDVLNQYDICIIVDEIQTFGRTPSPFAYQYFNLENYVDIVTVGKLAQVCATLFSTNFKPKPGLISQTFTCSTAAIEASLAVLNVFETCCFFGESGLNASYHHLFESRLIALNKKYPGFFEGPYGLGSMLAFTPLGGDRTKVLNLAHALFESGIIAFITGNNPTRIRFLLPVGVLKNSDIDKIMAIVEEQVCILGQ